jgi:predicted RNA-binding Zn-ribbon protein involved in translation (DUF1610 family)
MPTTQNTIRNAETYRCTECGLNRPVQDFYRDRSKASGHRSLCKPCDLAKSRAYYRANFEDQLAKAKVRNERRRREAPPKPARPCFQCGAEFIPHSIRSKRCPSCASDGLSTARALERDPRRNGNVR